MDVSAALRAGDALHLACAIAARATGLITLDSVMAKNAKRLKLKPLTL
jgi:predicted nucleic acid-binding protein